MFERFSERARQVLVLAQEESRLLGHDFIGTEHILLGLLGVTDGLAAKVLESLDVSIEAARAKVAQAVPAPASGSPESPPFTPRAKKVLELSLREALHWGHHDIGTEHLLLGLAREGKGVATQVLVDLGATPDQVRDRVIEFLPPTGNVRGTAQPLMTVRPESARPRVDPPICPNCRVSLAEHIGWRPLESSGPPDTKAVAAIVIYCRSCGTALGVLPAADSPPSSR